MIHSKTNRAKFLLVLLIGQALLISIYLQESNLIIQSLMSSVIMANGILGAAWIIYSQYQEYKAKVPKAKTITRDGFPSSLTFSSIMDKYFRQRLDQYKPGQYVYVIKDIDVSGMYKIGRTHHPASRIGRFDVKLPFRIHIIAIIPCENMARFEADMHRSLKSQRINGEWFMLGDEDVELLIPLEMRHGNWNEYSKGIE